MGLLAKSLLKLKSSNELINKMIDGLKAERVGLDMHTWGRIIEHQMFCDAPFHLILELLDENKRIELLKNQEWYVNVDYLADNLGEMRGDVKKFYHAINCLTGCHWQQYNIYAKEAFKHIAQPVIPLIFPPTSPKDSPVAIDYSIKINGEFNTYVFRTWEKFGIYQLKHKF